MNNYEFLLRILTLLFGFSAITVSLVFYFQLRKPLALHFAGFLTGIFLQLFGDFISFLSQYLPNMWNNEGSYLFYIICFSSYLSFSYFGILFILSFKRKTLSLFHKMLIIIPIFTLSILEDLDIINERILIMTFALTTLFMLVNMLKFYRNISDKFLKKSITILVIESVILFPFLVFISLGKFTSLSITVIYIHMFLISVESLYFAYKFISKKPFLNEGVITKDFKDKYKLSEREIEITQLIINGMQNKDIAEKLCISLRTVTTHNSNIYKKVYVKNRIQLLNLFNENWT